MVKSDKAEADKHYEKMSREVIALIDHAGGVAKFIRKLRHSGVYIARSTVTSWYYNKKVPPEWAYKSLKKAYFPNFSVRKHVAEATVDVDSLLS